MSMSFSLVSVALLIANPSMTAQDAEIVTAKTSSVACPIGASREIVIQVSVKSGYHIQSNPASDMFLIPTVLELKTENGIMAGSPVYPPATPFRLNGTLLELSTYLGFFPIKILIEATTQARPGKYHLTGKLSYQACDSISCRMPRSINVSIPVEITEMTNMTNKK